MAAGDTLTRGHVDKGELRGHEGRRAMREYRVWSIEYRGAHRFGCRVSGCDEPISTGGEAGVAWVGRGSPSPPLGSKGGRLGEPSLPPGFSSLRLDCPPILHTRDSILSYVKVSWRRGRDWLRFAPGLRPDPADRLFAPAGSPNRGSHPFGGMHRSRVTVTRAHVSPKS
jgi:hypothetical protein